MKKNLFKSLLAAGIVAVGGYGITKSIGNDSAELDMLTLANVEALADGESGSNCIGSRFKVNPIPGGWHCENDKGNSCCPIL